MQNIREGEGEKSNFTDRLCFIGVCVYVKEFLNAISFSLSILDP